MTTTQTGRRGLHIGFLGIDGIGKTSMARMLETELKHAGRAVQQLSWRAYVDADPRPNIRASLRELWVESWRLMFLGTAEAAPLPPSYDEFQRDRWEDRLSSLNATSNVLAGPLAASWLELAAQVLLYHEVILPSCRRGITVIEESYPIKFVMKELISARALSNGSHADEEISSALRLLPDLFKPRAPNFGILISGPIDLAYRRRLSQSGKTNSSEDLGQAGKKGHDGFMELQGECDRRFREVAAADDRWIVFEMEDAPPEKNFARLMEAVRPRLG